MRCVTIRSAYSNEEVDAIIAAVALGGQEHYPGAGDNFPEVMQIAQNGRPKKHPDGAIRNPEIAISNTILPIGEDVSDMVVRCVAAVRKQREEGMNGFQSVRQVIVPLIDRGFNAVVVNFDEHDMDRADIWLLDTSGQGQNLRAIEGRLSRLFASEETTVTYPAPFAAYAYMNGQERALHQGRQFIEDDGYIKIDGEMPSTRESCGPMTVRNILMAMDPDHRLRDEPASWRDHDEMLSEAHGRNYLLQTDWDVEPVDVEDIVAQTRPTVARVAEVGVASFV